MTDSFVFYASFYEALSEVDDDAVRLAVYDGIAQYALTGEMPELKGVAAALFRLIKPQVDANNRRRENGSKGGRPKTEEKPSENQTETESKPKVNLTITKSKPNVNANVNVNVNNNINTYTAIINLLNLYAGTSFSAKSEATKRLIDARLNDGYAYDDFEKVIKTKTNEWKGTDMEKFLRPQTLFGTKFEAYLNQKPVKPKGQQFDERQYADGELERLVDDPLAELMAVME